MPQSVERSIYVLLASLALILLFWQWLPIAGVVWEIADLQIAMAVTALSFFGWFLVLTSTFLINHLGFFESCIRWSTTSSAARCLLPASRRLRFTRNPLRHPIYLGFIIAFWAAPTMTVGHLLFAAVTTADIFVGISLEERDLAEQFGDEYRRYKRARLSMLIPWRKSA